MQTNEAVITKQKSVINRTEIRRRLLQFARDTRHHSFTRVSSDTLNAIEGMVEQAIRLTVQTAPSRGKTL
jgi:hypothetical protein